MPWSLRIPDQLKQRRNDLSTGRARLLVFLQERFSSTHLFSSSGGFVAQIDERGTEPFSAEPFFRNEFQE